MNYRLSAAFSRRTSEVNEILIKGRFLLSIFLIHIFLGMASSSESSSAPRLSPPPLFAGQQQTADQQLDQLLTSQENPNQSYHRSSPTAPPHVRRETSRGIQDDSGGKPPAAYGPVTATRSRPPLDDDDNVQAQTLIAERRIYINPRQPMNRPSSNSPQKSEITARSRYPNIRSCASNGQEPARHATSGSYCRT